MQKGYEPGMRSFSSAGCGSRWTAIISMH